MRIPRLTLQAYKVYPVTMCFWNFHISVVWVYRLTLSGNGIPAVLVSRFDYENDPLGRRTHRVDTGTALDTYPTYGHQKSAKPKPMAQGGRDFKAVRMHGARSGIPRHSGNCNPNPEASPAFEAYAYNGRSEVTSSARYRGDNTADTSKPLHGRAREYAYDAIGNRIQSSDGIPAVVSSYTANALNQYTSRTVPGTLPVTGDAPTNVNVYVNGTLAGRQRTHWHGTVTADNTQSPVYAQAEVEAVHLPPDPQDPDEYTATTNHIFFAQSPEAFTYDLDGNMLSDGRFNYSWDARNQLICVETRNDLPVEVPRYKVEYTYDHGGRRILKQVFTPDNGNWLLIKSSSFAYDRWNVIAETVVDHALQTTNHCSYVWGKDLSGTMQGAGGVGGLLAVIRDDGVFAPTYDANGNITEYIVLETRNPQLETGAIAAHYEYDAFGNTVAQHGVLADSFNHRFSTKYWDAETRLYYYGYRFYKPELERWINRDPIGERGGINLYGFVGNTSVNRIDKLGLQATEAGEKDFRCECKDEEVRNALREAYKEATQMPLKTLWAFGFHFELEYGGYICCDKDTGEVKHTGPAEGAFRADYPTKDNKNKTRYYSNEDLLNLKYLPDDAHPSGGNFEAFALALISTTGNLLKPERDWEKVDCKKQLGESWDPVVFYHTHPRDSIFSRGDEGAADRLKIPVALMPGGRTTPPPDDSVIQVYHPNPPWAGKMKNIPYTPLPPTPPPP